MCTDCDKLKRPKWLQKPVCAVFANHASRPCVRYRRCVTKPMFHLRDATRVDLPAIVGIYNQAIAGRQASADLSEVTVDARREWFARQLSIVVAYTPDAEVVGWTSLAPYHSRAGYRPTAEVSTYIATRYHGRGLGSQLRAAILERAPGVGVDTVISLVFAHNAASIRLNQKFGFDRWGLLSGVVEMDGQRYDVVIFGRKLVHPKPPPESLGTNPG